MSQSMAGFCLCNLIPILVLQGMSKLPKDLHWTAEEQNKVKYTEVNSAIQYNAVQCSTVQC